MSGAGDGPAPATDTAALRVGEATPNPAAAQAGDATPNAAGAQAGEATPNAAAARTGEATPNAAAARTGDATPDPALVERIATRARAIAQQRLRHALQAQATAAGELDAGELDDELLDRVADEEADHADGPLLRVSVAEAAAEELGLDPAAALADPAAVRAREVLREAALREAASAEIRPRPVTPAAVLVEAVHVFGIETVPSGDRDIELRLADTGIDVRRPSTGNTIGRLRWADVRTVVVNRPRRGASGLRRPAQLVAGTDRGEVTFELVRLSDEEITNHLEPLIARNCEGFHGAVAS